MKIVATAAALLLVTSSLAGPIDPPAGDVAATQKPLAQLEPRTAIDDVSTPTDGFSVFVISAPGSYYLTGNLTATDGRHGLLIAASNVTVDLMGFTLDGAGLGASGITTGTANLSAIRIRNGVVSNWTTGVDLANAVAANVADVQAAACSGAGISVGTGAVVTRCTAERNTGDGIIIADSAVLTDSVASNNRANGITCGSRSEVTRCKADSNFVHGIAAGSSSRIHLNTADGNGISSATGAGIFCSTTTAGAIITDNVCIQNDHGIWVQGATGNFILRNIAGLSNFENFKIVLNNRTAPTAFGALSPAVNGNSGGASLGSTDPNANFSY